MNIVPKSPAELMAQFTSVRPEEIEMGPDMNSRYSEAYFTIADSINSLNQTSAMDLLQEFTVANADIINQTTSFSYVRALRNARKKEGLIFGQKLSKAVPKPTDSDSDDANTVDERLTTLINNTVHLTAQDEDSTVLAKHFPSGNYFLHATTTDSIVAILNEGRIKATVGFNDEVRGEKSNGGAFGVAGNYNRVSNLLGDARHLAGFIADPQIVMQEQGGYFAPPSKSCWDELQYYPDNDDALHIMQLRDAETHINLTVSSLDEASMNYAVLSGNQEALQVCPPEYMLKASFASSMKLIQENPNLLYRSYRIRPNGDFRFTEMLGHEGENISPFTALVAAAAEGAFGKDVSDKLTVHGLSLDLELMRIMEPVFERLHQQTDDLYKSIEGDVGTSSAIKVENTLFYCPEKDYEKWLRVLAHSPSQPRGIVTYDGKDVRVPAAFALAFPDYGRDSLSRQLSVLKNEQTIEWLEVFDEHPQGQPNHSYLILAREANMAGVLTLGDEGSLVVKSLDDLDEDDD